MPAPAFDSRFRDMMRPILWTVLAVGIALCLVFALALYLECRACRMETRRDLRSAIALFNENLNSTLNGLEGLLADTAPPPIPGV